MSGSHRVSRRQLLRIAESLSDGDLAVVSMVSDFRLMTGGQLFRLFFADRGDSGARVGRRCLERLVKVGVLGRLDRRIGGVRAGSSSFVYRLTTTGQRILAIDAPRRRLTEPSAQFVKHTLAIADVFVDLTEAARTMTGVDVISYQTEPRCWRRFQHANQTVVLRPDLFVVIGVGELEYRWFVEVDRATEHLPAIVRKSTTYHDYYHAGLEQERTGSFPRVLWATTTATRADSIAGALSRTSLTTQLFRVEQLDRITEVLTEGSA